MRREQPLATYRAKRNFAITAEPQGKRPPARGGNAFVIQQHDATRMHYDFRLEIAGVMVSWAVPKGPSLDPADKRLAVQTEDHPVEYNTFEGIIPQGEYGGGPVIVWDRGSWLPEGDPAQGLRKGRLTFALEGEKLQGKFTLTRMDKERSGPKSAWLLIKRTDEHVVRGKKGQVTDTLPLSVISGRTVQDVGKGSKAKTTRRTKRAPRAKTSGKEDRLEVAGISISSPGRVMDQVSGLTKGELAAYHEQVSEYFLPYVSGRPIAVVRCPQGDAAQCFFQKQKTPGLGKDVRTSHLAGHEVIYVENKSGVLQLVQFNAVEFHGWGAKIRKAQYPDWIVMDLDPDTSLEFSDVVDAALELRSLFQKLKLETWVKTTGGKGLHVVLPIWPKADWGRVKGFTRSIAETLAQQFPDRYVSNMSKAKRKGKIFVDYLRNGEGATAVLPYSPRARPGATVAMPVAWSQLRKIDPRQFTVRSAAAWIRRRKSDPWKDFFDCKQLLPRIA